MALLLGTLGGLISLTAIVTGVSVVISQSPKGTKPIHSSSSATKVAEESKFQPTEKKECTVFLTSVGDTYTIVSCGGNTSTYYFFNQSKNSLEVIKGISTQNDTAKKLGSPIKFWKERNWKTFKTFDSRGDTGGEAIQESFPIDYKSGAKDFPFSEYIQRICPTPSGVMTTYDLGYTCSKKANLDINTEQFNQVPKKQQFQSTFEHHGEKRCYAKDNNNQWKKINCDSSITIQSQ